MDNIKYSMPQVLEGSSSSDDFNNKSGGSLYWKYPDDSISLTSAKLQSILPDTTINSACSTFCRHPVDSFVSRVPELSPQLSTGTCTETFLNFLTLSENSKIYSTTCNNISEDLGGNNRVIPSYNNKDTASVDNERNNNTNNNKSKRLQRKQPKQTSSDIFETIKAAQNSMRDSESNFYNSLNCSTNLNNTACLRTLSSKGRTSLHLLFSESDCIKHKTDYTSVANISEVTQQDDVSNISLIPELSIKDIDKLKEDDNTYLCSEHSTINTSGGARNELFFDSQFSYINHVDCNKSTQEHGHLFKRQHLESHESSMPVGVTSMPNQTTLDKVKNYISQVENLKETRKTVSHEETRAHIPYRQEKIINPCTHEHINQTLSQNREVFGYAFPNIDHTQLIQLCCNNKYIENGTVSTRTSQNKFKPSICTCSSINTAEDINQNITKGKVNHSENEYEVEHCIKIKSKKRLTSQSLTINNKNGFQTKNKLQNHVKCKHQQIFTTTQSKSRNHLFRKEKMNEGYESLSSLVTDASTAVISEISQTEGSKNKDSCVLRSEENKLEDHPKDFTFNESKNICRQLFCRIGKEECVRTMICNTKLASDLNTKYEVTSHSEKRNQHKEYTDICKYVFNDSDFENEVEDNELVLTIPFSELKKNVNNPLMTEHSNSNTNSKPLATNSSNKQKLTVVNKKKKVKQVHNVKRKPKLEWKNRSMTKDIISKLQPVYGIESKIIFERLVEFLYKKIRETVENEIDFYTPVNEIKTELARLKIVKTNMDFYLFILKYFRMYEQEFVNKCVPCIQTFGRYNLVPKPSSDYMREIIEYK